MRHDGGYCESQLNDVTDRTGIGVTLRGRAVRTISEEELAAIAWEGLRRAFDPANIDPSDADAGSQAQSFLKATGEERKRRIVQMLVNRKLRNASFRKTVLEA